MRKVKKNIQEIVEEITNCKGEEVKLSISKGRKKTFKYLGIIESIYPSVFTVKPSKEMEIKTLSYSFSDVLCGDVKVKLLRKEVDK